MSFDMFANEERAGFIRATANPSLESDPGIWHNFVAGGAKSTMLGFAQTARAIDLLGSIGPIVQDKLSGGTTEQDKYFQEHDDVFNRAVDYWTPAPGEVGTAGRVVGSLVSGLSTVVLSPSLAVGGAQLGLGEDLVRKGVDVDKAVAAGAVAGTGLGVGIYMPILGNSLASRVILGGAGGNVLQGVATRGINQQILKGTAAEKDFNPWDKESLILDGLMGAAFGTLAHLTAPEKAAVKAAIAPSEADAILTANQARHLEDTTAPGRPVEASDLTAHAEAMKRAVDDVLNGRAANVEQGLQGVRFADDAQRVAAQEEVNAAVREQARATVVETILHNEAMAAAENTEGFLRTPEQMIALRAGKKAAEGAPELARAIEIANKPGFQRTAEEKVFLDAALKGSAFDRLTAEIPPPEPPPSIKAAPPKQGEGKAAKPVDPIVSEAQARIAAHPELADKAIYEDANGVQHTLASASEGVVRAKKEVGLFMEAAKCLLGVA